MQNRPERSAARAKARGQGEALTFGSWPEGVFVGANRDWLDWERETYPAHNRGENIITQFGGFVI